MIAIVEDDVAVRNSLEFTLGARGYDVCAYACADDALGSPIPGGADCFVIDYNLPDRDGVALLQEMRRRRETCPAILIASNPVARCRQGAQASRTLLLEKPLIGGILEQTIDRLLQSG